MRTIGTFAAVATLVVGASAPTLQAAPVDEGVATIAEEFSPKLISAERLQELLLANWGVARGDEGPPPIRYLPQRSERIEQFAQPDTTEHEAATHAALPEETRWAVANVERDFAPKLISASRLRDLLLEFHHVVEDGKPVDANYIMAPPSVPGAP
ncbi:hypothetical protein GVX82_00500 [Patescibacteria group bacterium]|jgi:hypothetical protein|nr:hypothetical protein [Patescibacteria group bacterium]